MKVIGTAGHIDHGKSALVRRLTGIDPDRLAEEKARGMTIDLGFAWLRLPSGREASIVDVPGHERFIKNMLAGAGGVDVALLVVAADEGVMPQTREHVDILELLGIDSAVVALTKSDLVDDDMLQLVDEEVRELLAGRTLAASPRIPVSAVSGAGIGRLLAALDSAVAAPTSRAELGQPYLPVDRVFVRRGFGPVVTGTLHAGPLTVGDDVELTPARLSARIRGLQTHGRTVEVAIPGSRVAVNLAGVAHDRISRGDVLAPPRRVTPTRRFDARIRVVDSAQQPLAHGTRATIHVGAAEAPSVVTVLGEPEIRPGVEAWVQIRAGRPLAVVRGQKFVLRLPSPARTVAGGTVVDVSPHHRRFDSAALERLRLLSSKDTTALVMALLVPGRLMRRDEIGSTLGADESLVDAALSRLVAQGEVAVVGDGYLSGRQWSRLVGFTATVLKQFHEENPLKSGIQSAELRRRVGWRGRNWQAALLRLQDESVVRSSGAFVSAAEYDPGDALQGDVAARVVEVLRAAGFSPPREAELRSELGVESRLLAALAESGQIVYLGNGLYLAREAYEALLKLTLDLIDRGGSVSVSELRDAAQTSRKYALAFLEHLDDERITRRQGDVRILGHRRPSCV